MPRDVVVVEGGAIGAATTLELARRGAQVVSNDRNGHGRGLTPAVSARNEAA